MFPGAQQELGCRQSGERYTLGTRGWEKQSLFAPQI
jgi:hypothetical protein